jgi:hypothetical protein
MAGEDKMRQWLERQALVLQGATALVMAVAAVAAVVFVPLQIAANDRATRAQAAREIYREFLNISIQRPELAMGHDCAPVDPVRGAAYESYVDYLLYTAEQVLSLNPADWETTIAARLAMHRGYLCSLGESDLDGVTPAVGALVGRVRQDCAELAPYDIGGRP